MRTHAALLRGINVGGRNRLAMSDLQTVICSLGHSPVATYIQSGNAVFAAADPAAGADSLADGLGRSQLADEMGRIPGGGLSSGTARNWATVTALLQMLED